MVLVVTELYDKLKNRATSLEIDAVDVDTTEIPLPTNLKRVEALVDK